VRPDHSPFLLPFVSDARSTPSQRYAATFPTVPHGPSPDPLPDRLGVCSRETSFFFLVTRPFHNQGALSFVPSPSADHARRGSHS